MQTRVEVKQKPVNVPFYITIECLLKKQPLSILTLKEARSLKPQKMSKVVLLHHVHPEKTSNPKDQSNCYMQIIYFIYKLFSYANRRMKKPWEVVFILTWSYCNTLTTGIYIKFR